MANLSSIVRRNFGEIVSHTRLSCELCTGLMERKLVNNSEYERLIRFWRDDLHSEGAVFLYNNVLIKLGETSEDKFIEAMLEGKNYRAVEILRRTTEDGGEIGAKEARISLSCLLKSELEFLKEIQNGNPYNSKGKFEGLNLEDEEIANKLVSGIFRREWRLDEENLVGQHGEKVDGFVARIKRTAECLQEGILWWNPNATQLPLNFVERRVQRLISAGEAEDPKALSEVLAVSGPFLWLVDSPGMGKSTVTTKLEEEWRKSLESWRVVIRLNLNLIQNSLQNVAKNEEDLSLSPFLQRFVPYIPLKSLSSRFLRGRPVKVVLLLDGLDEVCPQHEATMLRVLHSLLEAPKETFNSKFFSFVLSRPKPEESLRLEKVFLTTRPHLKNKIQMEFGVDAHSLLPLDLNEQIRFLSQTVSEVVDFPEEKAKAALSSIPFSARSLMGNPLMLFLLAQVLKSDGASFLEVFDLYDLYESFMEAKHLLFVVEKEDAGQWKQKTGHKVKKILDESLPHYFACALKQLQVFEFGPEGPCFPLLRYLPEGKKREELLSFGLLVLNSRGQVEFAHRSFAEFFYARLLTSQDTPVSLRDALFRQLYSPSFGTSFACENVEDFVLCVLKKRRSQIGTEESLLPISFDWLQRKEERKFVLASFLGGRLFPLLGEEILSSAVNFDLPEVTDLLLSLTVTSNKNADSAKWLTSRPLEWTRRTLFNIPASSAALSWNNNRAQLATALLCIDPQGLARSLTQQEIFSALTSCKNLIEIICGVSSHPKLEPVEIRHRREIVESRLGRSELRKILVSKESLETSTLKCKEAAWRLAEVFTKKELRSFITEEDSRVCDVVGNWLSKVTSVWGEDFLGDLVTFRFKFGKVEGRTLFEGRGLDFALDNLWGRLNEGTKGVGILREALLRGHDWSLLQKLEVQMQRRQVSLETLGEVNLVERVFGAEGNFLWDVAELVPVDILPFVIRYGKFRHFQKLLQTIREEEIRRPFYTQTFPGALLVSLFVDESVEIFNHLVSFAEKSVSLPNPSKKATFLLLLWLWGSMT